MTYRHIKCLYEQSKADVYWHPHNNYYLRYAKGFAASNQGVLYQEKYLSSAKVFYCPRLESTDTVPHLSKYKHYTEQFNGYPTSEEMASMGNNWNHYHTALDLLTDAVQ